MLVCLPPTAKTHAYGLKFDGSSGTHSFSIGDWVLLDTSCDKIQKQCGRIHLPSTLQVYLSRWEGQDAIFERKARVGDADAKDWPDKDLYIGQHGSQPNSYNQYPYNHVYNQYGQPYPSTSILGCMPDRLHLGEDERCFKQVMRSLNGSQCLGVACVRDEPGAPCRALPSCLRGLQLWAKGPTNSDPASYPIAATSPYL